MTLSRWLRDYLYIPLGGNRGSDAFMYRNLMLTMVIGGLWHGANWTFVIWGTIQGVALVGERIVKKAWAQRDPIGLPAWLVAVAPVVPDLPGDLPGLGLLPGAELLAGHGRAGPAVLGRRQLDAGHAAADLHDRGHAGFAVRAAPHPGAGHRGVRPHRPGGPGGRARRRASCWSTASARPASPRSSTSSSDCPRTTVTATRPDPERQPPARRRRSIWSRGPGTAPRCPPARCWPSCWRRC